jgi:tRNA G18 (ribose-2'-O)-methylase SpoU
VEEDGGWAGEGVVYGDGGQGGHTAYYKLSEYKKSGSDLVLIGSEGAGVSPHLVKESTAILTIEKKSSPEFPDSLVDSLNVNAAVATILFELTKS